MIELSDEQIAILVEAANMYRQSGGMPASRFYNHVPTGAYDSTKDKCRMFIHDGHAHFIASKKWIEGEKWHLLPEWMQLPWGSYADLPPKEK